MLKHTVTLHGHHLSCRGRPSAINKHSETTQGDHSSPGSSSLLLRFRPVLFSLQIPSKNRYSPLPMHFTECWDYRTKWNTVHCAVWEARKTKKEREEIAERHEGRNSLGDLGPFSAQRMRRGPSADSCKPLGAAWSCRSYSPVSEPAALAL